MRIELNSPVTVTIKSKLVWNETEIEIHNGEVYEFQANGEWKDLFKKCDADGYNNSYMSLYNSFKRSKENNWFALIGSINQNNDFLIGKKKQVTFSENGNFSCYANDVKGFYWNNFGELSLTITRIK